MCQKTTQYPTHTHTHLCTEQFAGIMCAENSRTQNTRYGTISTQEAHNNRQDVMRAWDASRNTRRTCMWGVCPLHGHLGPRIIDQPPCIIFKRSYHCRRRAQALATFRELKSLWSGPASMGPSTAPRHIAGALGRSFAEGGR